MNNIEKLIASTKINHAGTEATEAKLETMAKVIEMLVDALENYADPNKHDYLHDYMIAVNALQQAQEIAGVVC
jgi:hypothetical protein